MKNSQLTIDQLPDIDMEKRQFQASDFVNAKSEKKECVICGNKVKIRYMPKWLYRLYGEANQDPSKALFCKKCKEEFGPGLTAVVLDVIEEKIKVLNEIYGSQPNPEDSE